LQPAESDDSPAPDLLADADPLADTDPPTNAVAESTSPVEPTRLTSVKRTWPTESSRSYRTKRPAEREGLFPLIRKLLNNNRPEPYSRR